MTPTFTIKGRIPSKKNSVVITIVKGRLMRFPSSQYRTWNKDAKAQIASQMPNLFQGGTGVLKGKGLRLVFFAPDLREFDLTNKAESVMDTLVEAGFMADDNYNVVSKLVLEFGGLDRENPRVEIYDIKED